MKETFAIQGNKFEEGDQYDIVKEIGSGAFGNCYVASTSSGPPIFVIKKVSWLNAVLSRA